VDTLGSAVDGFEADREAGTHALQAYITHQARWAAFDYHATPLAAFAYFTASGELQFSFALIERGHRDTANQTLTTSATTQVSR
jgi:hypothetical protein